MFASDLTLAMLAWLIKSGYSYTGPDSAALERRSGRAGRSDDPPPVAYHDLGVGPDVHQKRDAGLGREVGGDQVGRRIRTDVAGD
jgi:hypothetical protein